MHRLVQRHQGRQIAFNGIIRRRTIWLLAVIRQYWTVKTRFAQSRLQVVQADAGVEEQNVG